MYVGSLMVYVYFLAKGLSFYLTPYLDRPHHLGYRYLRPAVFIGHTYGVAGSAMMIAMLAYSFRKRLKIFRNWGRLSNWLDIHIFFGIIGPLLIVLHTSFKVQGLVAVSFWSMVLVALSGIFGRFLYLQIPRNIQGDELSMRELDEMARGFSPRLQSEFGLSPEAAKELENKNLAEIEQDSRVSDMLWSLVKSEIMHWFRPYQAQKEIAAKWNIPHENLTEFLQTMHRQSLLRRRILLLNRVQQMFHYWHVVHKPFAIIMYVIMTVHVVVAVWTGYKWIF